MYAKDAAARPISKVMSPMQDGVPAVDTTRVQLHILFFIA